MAQSIKTNYIFNLLNTGSQMLFPLITFPYVCRVIQADGIGQVNFFSSIIGYISLFTCLGIPMYAIREIARDRDDVIKMNRTAVEILLLHALLTIVGYIIVAAMSVMVPEIKEDVSLFLILSLTIFFYAIGCEWFYQGIEDFKYITVRGLIVKVFSTILLFLFVKNRDDLMLYAWYTVIGVLGGNFFNFIRLKKYINRDNIILSQLQITRHLKPVLQVFAFSIVTSIYLQLNSILLGFMKNTLAVGYFTAATRIMSMVMKLSLCLGAVMMPRVSNLLAENKENEFRILIQKSYDFTLAVSLPLMMGLICCAPYLVKVLCGDEFVPAILSSQIIAPIILIVGISNVMGIQVLYPKGKINLVILCCSIGAVADLLLNLLLIPLFSYEGTSVAYLGAEMATTASMYFIAKKYMPMSFIRKSHLNYLLGCIIMSVVIVIIPNYIKASNLSILALQITLGGIAYLAFLLLSKDSLLMQTISRFQK